MLYSIILPTFGRPEDVTEFLTSLTKQANKNFEVIIADGSLDDSVSKVVQIFKENLPIQYFYRKGLGASESRNLACENANGEFLIFIDSDCIVPSDYLQKVDIFLKNNKVDGFGGPDAADDSFTPTQKAINYAMTSLLTSGGIRGKKKHIGKFQLRGFNMGISKIVFNKVGGFSGMQVAEDIDISMRLHKSGFKTALIADAFVYHKRKSNFRKFYKQLFMHGKGRIDLHIRHGNALRLIHLIPTFFVFFIVFGVFTILLSKIIFLIYISFLLLFTLLLLFDGTIKNKSCLIGILCVFASYLQLIAYGLGIAYNIIVRMIFGNKKESEKSVILKI